MADSEPGRDTPVTRILLADLPQSLADVLVEVIGTTSDLRVVGVIPDDAGALEEASRGADVVIVCGQPEKALRDHYAALLLARPALRILSVTTASDVGVLFWLGLRRRRRPVTTASDLADAIRLAHVIDPLQ